MPKKKNNKKKKLKTPKELVSYGDFILPPVVPGPEVNDLCNKVDQFYKNYPRQHRKQKASDLIKGAFYAARSECRSNPDWMSQAASSLRDVLYPLFSNQISKNNLIKLFKKYATNKSYRTKIQNKEFIRTFDNLDKLYKQLSDLTHHGTELKGFSEKEYINFSESNFDSLLRSFVVVLEKAFELQQVYIHTIIDLIVQKKRKTKVIKQELKLVLSVNPDAHQYFFAQVNEQWLKWLWENGFLDVLKQKAEDPTQYGYRTPEVNYLVRIAEKNPAKVVDIILEVKVSEATFNPEVVDQFLRICSTLPARQLSRLVNKLREERWIPLMGVFNQWGFDYEKMFKTLAEAKDYKSLITLVEAVLTTRSREEIEKSPRRGFTDDPFYFDDLPYTKVFEHLANISDEYAEEAFALVTRVMNEVILLGGKTEKETVFEIEEIYHLFDVDFFTLQLGKTEHLGQDNVRQLAAVIKVLAQRLIGDKCDKPAKVRNIYRNYIKPLPDSRAMWRLRLFVLSLCPEVFKEDLKSAFFRLFEVGDLYHEIISGAEYERALQNGFVVLDEDNRRDYVKRIIEYFSKQAKDHEDQKWRRNYGSRILSMIGDHLTEEEKNRVEENGFKLDPNYEPMPSIGEMRIGFVHPQGPITPVEFNKLPIGEIAQKLRSDWSPEKLRERYKGDDFLRPHNAEGAGELLRNDFPKRLQDYVNNAGLFFERNVLDQHYTYSFLRGIQEAIKNNRELASEVNWSGIFELFRAIKEAGEKEVFARCKRERDSFDAWLAGWDTVHSGMSDVIQELLNERNGSTIIDFSNYRDRLLGIISYLLSYPDPTPKDEEGENAIISQRADSGEYVASDPFTIAINSVRGRTFQALVMFVHQDGKQLPKEDTVRISPDVKKLYETVLDKEDTRAIMFMFGHYLPTFYFCNKEWVLELLSKIFPEAPEKKYLFTAAWEGYLANNLFEEIFFNDAIQKLYERGLALTEAEYPKQKHFREPDESIAVHFALAYTHYENFDFDHPLLKKFWQEGAQDHHSHFISFIGRSLISSDNNRLAEAEKRGIKIRERIRALWDWMLENYKDPQPFEEFGFWVNVEKDIFEIRWLTERLKKTLQKTKGVVTWDYALTKSIVQLANEAPQDTLEIARWYLLEGGVRGGKRRRPLLLDREWFDAIKILYENIDTQSGTKALINDLIREGGSVFWKFKDILDDNKV